MSSPAARCLQPLKCVDMRVGINGMGRIGRLALRAAMGGLYRGVPTIATAAGAARTMTAASSSSLSVQTATGA